MRALLLVSVLALGACVTEGGSKGSKPNLAEASRINAELGADYLRKGQIDVAQEKLLRALEQDSDNALAHASLALVYARTGEAKRAKYHFKEAISLDDGDPSTLNNYGTFLCTQGETADAEELFIKAMRDRRYTTPEVALTNAGVCLQSTSKPERAEAYFREALERNPAFPDALAQMARLSFDNEDYLRARAFIQRFERSGRHSAETLELAERTERALGDRKTAAEYERRRKQQFPDRRPSSSR